MSGYEVASLTDVESLPGPGSLRWTPLRKHFGITAFGINAYTATEAGQGIRSCLALLAPSEARGCTRGAVKRANTRCRRLHQRRARTRCMRSVRRVARRGS